MERLTSRDSKGNLCLCNKEVYGNNQDIYNAIAVLEDYENTGITPEQLQVINEEYSKMAKELAELRQQNQWIPVSERLPEPGIYLATCDDKDYPVKRMRMKGICFYDHNGIYDGKVLAWMLLPEPYKE